MRIPLLDFDSSRDALIEPSRTVRPIAIPEACVVCFFADVIARLRDDGLLTQVAEQRSEIGAHPIYTFPVGDGGARLALFHPGIGAPLAAGLLEEVIALGCRRFVVCGAAGTLDATLTVGHLVVPTDALRDEGTSYHYLAAEAPARPSPRALAALTRVLDRRALPYERGRTWTTDAIYRETPAKIARRRAEGCVTVEMEAAALFAVATFRAVDLAVLLYAGDDVSGAEWDTRRWNTRADVREQLFWLAAEACQEMAP